MVLDHVISKEGIHVDPSKVIAIKNCAIPKTPCRSTKLLRFIQLISEIYYKSLYDSEATHSLDLGEVNFDWNNKQETALGEVNYVQHRRDN